MKAIQKIRVVNVSRRGVTYSVHRAVVYLGIYMFCIVFLGMGGCGTVTSKDLDLELAADSVQNHNSEVRIQLKFKNVSDSRVVLYSWRGSIQGCIGSYLDFTVVNSQGDTLECAPAGAMPKLPHQRDTLNLEPDEVYVEEINLTAFYTTSENKYEDVSWDSLSFWGKRKWECGQYKIQAKYHIQSIDKRARKIGLWRGSVESNEVIVTITH